MTNEDTKAWRENLKRMMSDLIGHFRTQSATGLNLDISQQTVFVAKEYGRGSLDLYLKTERLWRELGYGPSDAVAQAAEFARVNGISEETITAVSEWKWGKGDTAHKIYMQMWAEHERESVRSRMVDNSDEE